MPRRQLGFDGVLTVEQPVHRRVDLVGGRPSHARSAPRVVSSHQLRVANFEAGATTRETISAIARSRYRQAGPSRAGRPNVWAIAVTAATWPCGSDNSIATASAAGRSVVPASTASIAVIAASGSTDRLASCSCLTLAPSR